MNPSGANTRWTVAAGLLALTSFGLGACGGGAPVEQDAEALRASYTGTVVASVPSVPTESVEFGSPVERPTATRAVPSGTLPPPAGPSPEPPAPSPLTDAEVADLDEPPPNLIKNPWFRSARNPSRPGLDGWTDAAGPNTHWSLSQKASNPSPDDVVGTAARWAYGRGQGGGEGVPGVDAFLYQVVEADPSHTALLFQTWWVALFVEEASVNIYGGSTAEGPWRLLWRPFLLTERSDGTWRQTPLLTVRLERGYPYYKVELQGRYEGDRRLGVKYTGVYFATMP